MRCRRYRQGGSLTLFTALIVLPTLFFILSLTFDLSLYYTATRRAQRMADEAVMYAYRFLPAQEESRKALELYLAQHAPKAASARSEISISSDFITLVYKGLWPLTFARLAGADLSLPFNVTSSARATPLDIYLALDTSSYLAPEVLGNEAWGEPGVWPAADYFNHERFFYKLDPATSSPTEEQIDPRIVTQQCFNEAFSPIKQAAVQLYDYAGSFALNSVGVGFYPGYKLALDPAREVTEPGKGDAAPEAFLESIYGGLYQSSLFCAAAAAKEINHPDYRFPPASSQLRDPELCPGSLMTFDSESGKVADDYLSCIQTRQVIWSRPVFPGLGHDFPSVVRELSSSLAAARVRNDRSGLLASSSKVGIILAGGLPMSGTLRFPHPDVYSRLEQSLRIAASEAEKFEYDYSLYYVLFHRADSLDTEALDDLRTLFNQINEGDLTKGSFKVKLFFAENATQAINELLSLLILQKRTVMLAK